MSQFLDQFREGMRTAHYNLRTEEAYLGWIRRFILFHGKRHPREMGEAEVASFLSHLANEGQVAASTQNQALGALLYLDKAVLDRPLEQVRGIAPAKRPERLPVAYRKGDGRNCRREKGALIRSHSSHDPPLLASTFDRLESHSPSGIFRRKSANAPAIFRNVRMKTVSFHPSKIAKGSIRCPPLPKLASSQTS